jgi:hypothetical protein
VAREVVLIPISREPLCEAVAVFLAVLAYPDQAMRSGAPSLPQHGSVSI